MKPLSAGMIELLMDCHERELMNFPPNRATKQHSTSLLKRKLLTARVYTDKEGKTIISLYTTQLGRDYLTNIMKDDASKLLSTHSSAK